jgi:hypothetical protein
MKPKKKQLTMASEIGWLLDELCVELGFCLPPKEMQRMISSQSCEADQFTQEVFRAENMNPNEHRHLMRQVRRKFTDRFGKQVNLLDFPES